jgi:tetratricopeptide (TPR) repeat protein
MRGRFAWEYKREYRDLAGLSKKTEKPEQALELYDKAIVTLEAVLKQQKNHRLAEPFLPQLLKARANFFDELGRHSDACKDWDRAVQMSSGIGRAEIRLARAASLAQLGSCQQAITEANAVVAEIPSNGNLLYEAARVFAFVFGSRSQRYEVFPGRPEAAGRTAC